jgi:hypothetical protein
MVMLTSRVSFGTTEPLQRGLLSQFADQAIMIEAVTDHVIVSTPSASTHVKRPMLAEIQKQGLISSPNQTRKTLTQTARSLSSRPYRPAGPGRATAGHMPARTISGLSEVMGHYLW